MKRTRRKTLACILMISLVVLVLPLVAGWHAEEQRWRCFQSLRESRASPADYRRAFGTPSERWLEDDGIWTCETFRITQSAVATSCFDPSSGRHGVDVAHACFALPPPLVHIVSEYLRGVRSLLLPEGCTKVLIFQEFRNLFFNSGRP